MYVKHPYFTCSLILISDMAFMAMRSLRPYSQATPGVRFSILGADTGHFHIHRTLSGENLNNLTPAVEAKEPSLAAEKCKKRAIVVNSKWGERSVDPLYSHLLYSSEVIPKQSLIHRYYILALPRLML